MQWKKLGKEPCSVARAVSVIGDRWTLLVLRDCFLGVRRFEAFENRLRIPRPVLADRLRKLVRSEVLKKTLYEKRPARYEYRLTEKGLDLYPVIMALVHWGDVHMAPGGRPLLHRHSCGHRFDPVMVCSQCETELKAREVTVAPGPGGRQNPRKPPKIAGFSSPRPRS
ncbi:MAG TPA: helix-turn-helix domain-containing protein [Xanthobacteraceae bacterium]|nr:helix-turn-helix domain-containing protein [Xanthobacteraceae bacterium]